MKDPASNTVAGDTSTIVFLGLECAGPAGAPRDSSMQWSRGELGAFGRGRGCLSLKILRLMPATRWAVGSRRSEGRDDDGVT